MASQEPLQRSPQRRTELFLILTILVTVCVTYYPSLNGPLLLDDHGSVLPSKIFELSFAELYRVAIGDKSGILGRAIPVTTFALNLHFWPDSVYALKLTNLIIHLLNSILVLLFVRSVLRIALPTSTLKEINLISIACAAIWVIHPLQVSTTMYVVQRMAMLSTSFTLLALLSYVHFRNSFSLTAPKLIVASSCVILFTLLACMCKENGVLIFLYIFVLEFSLFKFQQRKYQTKPQLITLWSICCFIPLIAGCLLFFFLYDGIMTNYNTRNFDLYQRLMTEPGIIMMYIKMILLPNLNEMQFYYDAYPVVTEQNRESIISLCMIIIMFFAFLTTSRKYPILSVGLGIFLVSHLLESTALPLELVFEHRNYLSILGLVVPIVWALSALAKKRVSTYLTTIPVVFVFLIFSLQTHSRSVEWSDAVTLKMFTLSADPQSARARTSLVADFHNRKNPAKAIELLREGLIVNPDNTLIPALLYHMLAINNQVSDKDLEMIKERLANGRIDKSLIFELMIMQRDMKRSDVDIDPHVLKSFFEIVLTNQDNHLANTTKGQFMASYAQLLDYLNEKDLALDAINTALEYNESDDSFRAFHSYILSSIE